jgi:ArsR family transcriptional regulator
MARDSGAVRLQVEPVAQFFRAMGDETRVRIIALLAHGELCVCHVQQALGLTQPNASRHLTILKRAGVVRSRRDGTWIHYALAPQPDEHRKRQLRALVASFSEQDVLRSDVERLLKAKGPNSCP